MKTLGSSPIFLIGLGLSLALAGCGSPFKASGLPSAKSSPEIPRVIAGQPPNSTPSSRQTTTSSLWVQSQTTLDGRNDPFALLPEELWIKDQPGDQTNTQPGTLSTPIVSPPVITGSLRGIIMGNPPSAYVEEDGNYRKVTVGDLFSGGTITAITKDSLTVAKGGERLIIRLGE